MSPKRLEVRERARRDTQKEGWMVCVMGAV